MQQTKMFFTALTVIHFYSTANLLLEFIHGKRDALLPGLLVFLLHGRLQVLLQLLIQLGDRGSTSETVGGRSLPVSSRQKRRQLLLAYLLSQTFHCAQAAQYRKNTKHMHRNHSLFVANILQIFKSPKFFSNSHGRKNTKIK